ncbi:MAG: YceI family protein [Bacteroidales bacterium]|nr:YceI family protein [Bacteroidales bacterium]
MKTTKIFSLIALTLVILASCAGPSERRAEIMERLEAGEIPAEVDVFTVDAVNSTVAWLGTKIGGQHDGTIGVHHGELYVYEGDLLAGNVVIDMTRIVVLDIEDPTMNARLKGHLESDDFFSAATYPTAEFEITGIEPLDYPNEEETHRVYGNMTIKGITHGIAFNAKIIIEDAWISTYADFDLDRADWDVRFGSGRFFDNLGDNLIHDDFNLKLHIVANRNQ